MTTVKDIENYLNDYLVSHNTLQSIIFDNLFLFYKIAKEVEETLEPYFKNGISFDIDTLTKMTLKDKIKLVKNYFQDNSIEFEIEQYINDGTIAFIDYNQLENNFDYFYIGNCARGNMHLENNRKKFVIDVCENGLVSDIPTLIHEISHYRDEPKERRNQVSDLLTETLAYAELYISADYLYKLGYTNDAQFVLKGEGNALYHIAKSIKKILKLFLVFMEFGNVSKESYQYFFKSINENFNDYTENLTFLAEHPSINVEYELLHLLGLYLASFLLEGYKKDHSYMKTIVKLHEEINQSDFLTCIKMMGLTDLGLEDRKCILNSICHIKDTYFNQKNSLEKEGHSL